MLRQSLEAFLAEHATTLASDEVDLTEFTNDPSSLKEKNPNIYHWNYLNALNYRITRKRIALKLIEKINILIKLFDCIINISQSKSDAELIFQVKYFFHAVNYI